MTTSVSTAARSMEDSSVRRMSVEIVRSVSIALVAALALVAGVAAAQVAGSKRDLIASGDSPDLFIVYTGDVIGYIEPCG